MAVPSRDQCHVTAQTGSLYGRWAYVLHLPGEWPHVSPARYSSATAALAAGEHDLSATLAFYAEGDLGVLTAANRGTGEVS